MASSDARTFVRRLLRWGRENQRDFPWRREVDPFRVLVAELMLQRSRGKTVATVYETLFSRWGTVAGLARASESEIAEIIRPIGLIRRAATLKALAREVLRRGSVPSSVEELMTLPGIGRYAAHATAAVAFGKHVATVDGVSARVYRRYFGLSATRPPADDEALWEIVAEVTPRGRVREWNWAVLDHAATICRPKVPRCEECPLLGACAYPARLAKLSDPSA